MGRSPVHSSFVGASEVATKVGDLIPVLSRPEVGLFLTCCAAIAFVGFLLALMEESPKAGYSNAPTSHLMECADSTDLLFSDLFSDGTGLGLLEPLWRLFTPEGALWTLLTGWDPRDHASSLGLTGMLEAVASLIATGLTLFNHAMAALLRLLCPSRRSKASKGEKEKASTAHEKIQMTFLQEAHAYFGYVRLFGLGLIREYIIRACAFFLKDELCVRYMQREKWSVGWTDFYLQHMYKLYVDCFARPIASAPDAAVDVVIRERAGGDLFGPLNDLKLTKNTRKCVNLSSYNYLGFGGVDELLGSRGFWHLRMSCAVSDAQVLHPRCTKGCAGDGLVHLGNPYRRGYQGVTLAFLAVLCSALPCACHEDIHRQLEDEVAAYLQKASPRALPEGVTVSQVREEHTKGESRP